MIHNDETPPRRGAFAVLLAMLCLTLAASPAVAETEPVPGTAGMTVKRWPHGPSGWTVILETSRSRTHAARTAASAVDGPGFPCGVLRSSEHASLRPGYWVVWCGRSRSAAKMRRLQRAIRSYGTGPLGKDAYVRWVSRRR